MTMTKKRKAKAEPGFTIGTGTKMQGRDHHGSLKIVQEVYHGSVKRPSKKRGQQTGFTPEFVWVKGKNDPPPFAESPAGEWRSLNPEHFSRIVIFLTEAQRRNKKLVKKRIKEMQQYMTCYYGYPKDAEVEIGDPKRGVKIYSPSNHDNQ
jgi:hypothetical protein